MTKWEYTEAYYGFDFLLSLAHFLNEFGKTGWELVTVLEWNDGYKFILKRPLPKFESAVDFDDLDGEC